MQVDIALVGGGLSSGLIAHRLLSSQPSTRLVLIEREPRLGGQHVWSFHDADLSAEQRRWIAPLVTASWPVHEVRFPGFTRRFESGYQSIRSEDFHDRLLETLGDRALTASDATHVAPDHVELADGRRIDARVVVDGRGWPASADERGRFDVGYQKFVGLHLELERPHGLRGPILMDATVEQIDGYRFLYTLPFGERSVLIEDTRYSDGPELSSEAMRTEIRTYAEGMGWSIDTEVGEERGVLPIVLAGDIDGYWSTAIEEIPPAGMRAALFQPTTGYSLPQAVALADLLAASDLPNGGEVFDMIRSHSIQSWRRQRFFRFLNRMLFRAAAPAGRRRVMETFYRRPEGLIQRFYADRLTLGDRVRILSGRPPVSPLRALACVAETRP